ncbi:MAG: hypothetical protein QOH10_2081 [Actinomycetota bacterium]|nr:hypothetical protein [Actinomycetota bacterium]
MILLVPRPVLLVRPRQRAQVPGDNMIDHIPDRPALTRTLHIQLGRHRTRDSAPHLLGGIVEVIDHPQRVPGGPTNLQKRAGDLGL